MEIVVAALIGLVAGIGAGLAGIGGGVVIVPALVFLLDFAQHIAQGTSLLAIVFTAISGTLVNRRNGNVDLRVALTIGAFGAIAGFLAARAANLLDGETLRTLFGILIVFSGTRMLFQTLRS